MMDNTVFLLLLCPKNFKDYGFHYIEGFLIYEIAVTYPCFPNEMEYSEIAYDLV